MVVFQAIRDGLIYDYNSVKEQSIFYEMSSRHNVFFYEMLNVFCRDPAAGAQEKGFLAYLVASGSRHYSPTSSSGRDDIP